MKQQKNVREDFRFDFIKKILNFIISKSEKKTLPGYEKSKQYLNSIKSRKMFFCFHYIQLIYIPKRAWSREGKN